MENPLKIKRIMAFILIATILSSCVKSESETIKNVKEVAKTIFTAENEISPNTHLDDLSLYLPKRFHVKEEETSNIILNDGKQTYIVFYNNLEEPTSELNYNAAKGDQALLFEAFRDNEKFGYIRVLPEEEGDYELQVGVGGVKITTYTKKSKLKRDTEDLMEISLSTLPNTQPESKEERED